MKLDVEEDDYRRIEDLIASDDSPVGIDAKRTHVLILDKLLKIERRLERLERRIHGTERTGHLGTRLAACADRKVRGRPVPIRRANR